MAFRLYFLSTVLGLLASADQRGPVENVPASSGYSLPALGAPDDPKPSDPVPLSVTGIKEVQPYKLQRLTVVGVPSGYTILWDVYPFEGLDEAAQKNKSTYEFIIPPGTYKARVRAFKGEDVLQGWFEFTVKPAVPVTPVDPVTPPAPNPETKFGLTQTSRAGAKGHKAAELKALAGSIRAFATAVTAGGQPDPSNSTATAKLVLGNWADSNATALSGAGGTTSDWKAWADAVATQFFAQYNAGKIKTKQDWVDAFNEIAAGLE